MKQRPVSVLAVLMLAVASSTIAGQSGTPPQNPPGAAAPLVRTASVSGQVVDGDTGAPIGGALVRLTSRLLAAGGGGRAGGAAQGPVPPGSDAVITDGDGRFVFHNLPRGATQLQATASGYLDRPAAGVPQRPIQLEDGKHFGDVRLPLLKVASVTGVVLDEAGEPVVGLVVRFLRREAPQGISRVTLSGIARTDDRGQYRLDNLAPGQLYVVAPQMQTTVPVSEADRSGMSAMFAGMSPLIEAMTGGTQSTLGSAGLRVGDQVVRTSGDMGPGGAGNAPPPPVNGRLAAYQTTFYPGVTQLSQAMAITLRSGEERTGIDFQIRPTASARVSGVLTGASGPAAGTVIRLVPAPGRPDDDALAVATATTGADGSFAFLGVPTGQYIAKAQSAPRGGMPLNLPAEVMANIPPEVLTQLQSRMSSGDSYFLQAPVSVGDRDVIGLNLALRAGSKLSGEVVFNGTSAKPPALTNVQVSFAPIGGPPNSGAQAKVTADATFTTGNAAPGMYTPAASGVPGPWMLRSVTVDGRDVLLTGVEVGDSDISGVELVFTDKPSSITGTVRQDSAGTLPNSTVLLVSANYRVALSAGVSPRQQTAAVQPTGAFTLGRLLPGDYLVVALPDDAVPVDHDAAFFDAMARLGTRVTVNEGEVKTQDLKIVRSIR